MAYITTKCTRLIIVLAMKGKQLKRMGNLALHNVETLRIVESLIGQTYQPGGMLLHAGPQSISDLIENVLQGGAKVVGQCFFYVQWKLR